MEDLRRIIIPLGAEDRTYEINGVSYIVASRFTPLKIKDEDTTAADRVCRYCEIYSADLIESENTYILDCECVSAAGKEE